MSAQISGARTGVPGVSAMLPHGLAVAAQLARTAEALLAGPDPQPGPARAVRLATAQVLLALHWELRHQAAPEPALDGLSALGTGVDPSVAWLSALLCSGVASAD
jgi:hypothetical protein